MTGRRLIRVALAASALGAATSAGAQLLDMQRVTGLPTVSEQIAEIERATSNGFEAVLKRYDDLRTGRPYDVTIAIAECEFIDSYASRREDYDDSDAVSERGEQCDSDLNEHWGENPEVELRKLARIYPDAARLKAGRTMVDRSERAGWTAGQLGRLYTLLTTAADRVNDPATIRYAKLALYFDERVDVRLVLARRLLSTHDAAGAREALSSPYDASDLASEIELLGRVGLRERAVAVHAQLALRGGYYDHVRVAHALGSLGEIDLARGELQSAESAGRYTTRDERERFVLELRDGSGADALSAYNAWRDQGWIQDPIGINRWTLFMRDPGLPWRWRDLVGLGTLCFALLGVGLAAAIPVALVHYRGLVRRARSAEPYPVDGWRLADAWWALSALIVAGLLALYRVGPVDLESGMPRRIGEDLGPWSHLLIAQTSIELLLLAFVARSASRRQLTAWYGTWSIAKSISIPLAIALAFRIPMILVWWFWPQVISNATGDDDLWRLMSATSAQYGPVAVVWAVAIAAPVVEEIVFRGALLGAFSKHVSFGWANALQAALFAALHLNLQSAVWLFAIGAVAGWLVRRSGGLLAPIVLHSTFNLVAAVLAVAV